MKNHHLGNMFYFFQAPNSKSKYLNEPRNGTNGSLPSSTPLNWVDFFGVQAAPKSFATHFGESASDRKTLFTWLGVPKLFVVGDWFFQSFLDFVPDIFCCMRTLYQKEIPHRTWVHTLPETNIAPEIKQPLGKGDSYWKPSFLGAMLVQGG